MYSIEKHDRINQLFMVYHRLGLWHNESMTVLQKIGLKFFYIISYVIFLVSLTLGAFFNDNMSEAIFSLSAVFTGWVATVKLIYILWKKNEILEFTDNVCAHFVIDDVQCNEIKKKLKNFIDFATCFVTSIFVGVFFIFVSSFVFWNEKKLPLKIAFPFDLRSEIGYWLANLYLFIFSALSVVFISIGVIVWYLMLNCSIKYDILGQCFRDVGSMKFFQPIGKETNISLGEFIGLIKIHQNLQETVKRLKSLFSVLFFMQITTSGLCMCFTIYGLVFADKVNLFEQAFFAVAMFHNVFDIFMVMHFGNEIKLSSDRLSYCLFESNWMDQSTSFKKTMIMLLEAIKRPQELIVGKLYPLNLQTFTSILSFAYSTFNMLQQLN